MPNRHRKVLAIGLTPDEFRTVDHFLAPGGLEVDRFPSVLGALELAGTLPLDALVVRYPMPEMSLREFLDRLRRPDTQSNQAPVVIVSQAKHRDKAERFIGRGAARVVALDTESHTLLEAVMGVIFVAPRRAVRFPAQFHREGSEVGDVIPCQVRNSSISGALLETDHRPDKGTRVFFRFSLPTIERPVVGVAEVVRHTNPAREPVSGVGIRFLSFAGSSKTIYESYLHSVDGG